MKAAWTNGAKSPGPSTPDAKRKISMNAYKHGLTAQSVLAPGENPELLRALADSFLAIFEPADDAEFLLVEEMIGAKWRLRRGWSAENVLIQSEIATQKDKLDAEFTSSPGPDLRYALALRELTDNSNSLAHIHRQEVRYTRREPESVEKEHTPENPAPAELVTANETNRLEPGDTKIQNNPEPFETYPPTGAK